MKRLGLLAIFLFLLVEANAQSAGLNHPATDSLGRSLPTYEEVGDIRTNKTVAMFYWTWHVGHSVNNKAYDLGKIITDLAMVNDYTHPLWDPYADQGTFFWGEPLFDYYDGRDKWVIRKQLEMLGAAGVDVLFYDATNGNSTWKDGYEAVGQVMGEARADGVTVPQFAFMLNFGPQTTTAEALVQLYDELYSLGKYQDSWFMWGGKPVVMAYPEALDNPPAADVSGLEFTADSAFSGIDVKCPSYGNNIGDLTLSLYAWNETYAESVSQPPLVSQTFIDYNDNAILSMEFSQLAAGDYVWELSDAREVVGIWKYPEDTPLTVSYFNGALISGEYVSRIKYVSAGFFSPLTSGASTTPVRIDVAMDSATLATIKTFFTFRPGQPKYETGSTRFDQWGWLENAPQNGYVENSPGEYEWMTVGVAQNWSESQNQLSAMNGPQIHGRSYTDAGGFSQLTTNSYLYGYNFQEQWDRALQVDPDIIFITGWNEWVVGRFETWMGVTNAFPDQFDLEYSRDIEPMKGGCGDNYYYQMVSNIRKFKGMKKPESVSPRKTVSIDGGFSDWADVKPGFSASQGNVQLRDGYGYIDPDSPTREHFHYLNNNGRNDIVAAKAARDEDFVYFHVKVADILTSYADTNWMQLLIDADRDKQTGWEGYDFLVDRYGADGMAVLGKSSGEWNWPEVARVDFKVAGAEMEIAVPRTFLDSPDSRALDFEFKWLDNYTQSGDIMDFYTSGEVAPGGRFNYRYTESSQLFQDTFEGRVIWDDPNQDLSVRQAGGSVGSTYSVDGSNWRTLIDPSVGWGVSNVLLGRIVVSDGGGGELALDLDADFGADLAHHVWTLGFKGQIQASTGFSGWTGFAVGNPANLSGVNGTGFGFSISLDGFYNAWNNGSNLASVATGYGLAGKVYGLVATFDEVACTVRLDYSDGATNFNMGTYPVEFADGCRFIELKNHVDTSIADGIVDMRWDDLSLEVVSHTPLPFYTKWAERNGLSGGNASRDADPDGDGLDNFSEYVVGGNPNLTDASTALPASEFTVEGGTYAYNRRRDAAARGLSYGMAYKLDLFDPDWTFVGSAWETATNSVDSYLESVVNEFPLPDPDQGFLRLEVTEIPFF